MLFRSHKHKIPSSSHSSSVFVVFLVAVARTTSNASSSFASSASKTNRSTRTSTMASGLFRPLLFLRARSPRRLLVDRAGTIVLPLLDDDDVLELESLGCRRAAAGAKLFISFGEKTLLYKQLHAALGCLSHPAPRERCRRRRRRRRRAFFVEEDEATSTRKKALRSAVVAT